MALNSTVLHTSYSVQERRYTLLKEKHSWKKQVGYYNEQCQSHLRRSGISRLFRIRWRKRSIYLAEKHLIRWLPGSSFDYLLEKANIVGTPGSGFGAHGEGFFRLTAFGTQEIHWKQLNELRICKQLPDRDEWDYNSQNLAESSKFPVEQLFGVELRSEADDFIHLTMKMKNGRTKNPWKSRVSDLSFLFYKNIYGIWLLFKY